MHTQPRKGLRLCITQTTSAHTKTFTVHIMSRVNNNAFQQSMIEDNDHVLVPMQEMPAWPGFYVVITILLYSDLWY